MFPFKTFEYQNFPKKLPQSKLMYKDVTIKLPSKFHNQFRFTTKPLWNKIPEQVETHKMKTRQFFCVFCSYISCVATIFFIGIILELFMFQFNGFSFNFV